jgi:hypothetical protein
MYPKLSSFLILQFKVAILRQIKSQFQDSISSIKNLSKMSHTCLLNVMFYFLIVPLYARLYMCWIMIPRYYIRLSNYR